MIRISKSDHPASFHFDEILHRDLSLRRAITVQDFYDDWQSWESR